MPVKSVVDLDDGVIRFTVSGPLTKAEMQEALDGIYSVSEGDLPSSYLWDLRKAEIDWTGEMVKAFVTWVQGNRPEGDSRNAVVASTDLQFGLARMYEMLTSELPVNLMVFRDLETATAWLRVDAGSSESPPPPVAEPGR